ncbi:MAG: hypothetical protein CL676_06735 [Bdellovibrionaceae bacterium]|nr:hypothetical protein [Pseudobdellovibrionaceae bacterium]|tara:strand:+ start:1786 stop:2136 length:351 start_codon:yes stop_codon:yes gene_type:complete
MSTSNVRKVQPYPFSFYVQRDGKFLVEEALKLSQTGAMVKATGPLYLVGSEFLVNFTLPVLKLEVSCQAKVMKTYDRAMIRDKTVERLVEFRFLNLDSEQQKGIQSFLIRIGQIRR